MKSIFHGRRRILVNYLTSYISIALLSCVLVGALLTWYSANNLQGQLQQEINEKARNVLDDLDNQIQHMSAIADTIAVEDRYKPAIFRHNNYQEMEMLESFTQYRYVSSISDSYFLLYRDKDRVYRSDGRTSRFVTLYRQISPGADASEMWDALCRTESFNVYTPSEHSNSILFAFPVKMNYSPLRSSTATLVFVVKKTLVAERIEAVMGALAANAELRYRDTPILAGNGFAAADFLFASARGFSLTLYPDANNSLRSAVVLSKTLLIILACCIAGMVSLAAWAAYRSYLPIQVLADKYHIAGEDELKNIDGLLNTFIQQREVEDAQQEEHASLMTEQVLRLLLYGYRSASLEKAARLLQLRLEAACFCIFSFQSPREKSGELIALLAQMTDEDMSAYPFVESEKGDAARIAVLFAFENERMINAIEDTVRAVLQEKLSVFKLNAGHVCQSIEDLPASFAALQTEAAADDGEDCSDISGLLYNHAVVTEAMTGLRRGDFESAWAAVAAFFQALEKERISEVMRRNIYGDIIAQFVRSGFELQCPLNEGQIQMLQHLQGEPFLCCLRKILEQWNGWLEKQRSVRNAETEESVIQYVRDHCTEYEICLEGIGAHFGMTGIQVSKLIRRRLDKTYKEFLTELRVECAKRILTDETAPLVEVCERVGYTNISHFIKVFRMSTGQTPNEYRKYMLQEEMEHER